MHKRHRFALIEIFFVHSNKNMKQRKQKKLFQHGATTIGGTTLAMTPLSATITNVTLSMNSSKFNIVMLSVSFRQQQESLFYFRFCHSNVGSKVPLI
jgi:hypothetical protein